MFQQLSIGLAYCHDRVGASAMLCRCGQLCTALKLPGVDLRARTSTA